MTNIKYVGLKPAKKDIFLTVLEVKVFLLSEKAFYCLLLGVLCKKKYLLNL